MTILQLYTGGGISLSPLNGDGRYLSDYVRLIADDGKMLTNGERTALCLDVLVNDASNWTEIDAPAEEIDDSEAVEILLGGAS